MKTYTPETELAQADLTDIPHGLDRYCLSIPNIRMLRGNISRETAYYHARRWRKAGYAELERGGYVTFTPKAFFHFAPPFKYHKLCDQNLAHHAEVNMVEFWLRSRVDLHVVDVQGQRLTRHLLNLSPEESPQSKYFPPVCIPDLIAEVQSVKTQKIVQIAIEVERSYKGPERMDRTLRELTHAYAHTFYIASVANGVYGLVKACIENLPEELIPRFSLWKLDSIRLWQETQFSSKAKAVSTNGQSGQ